MNRIPHTICRIVAACLLTTVTTPIAFAQSQNESQLVKVTTKSRRRVVGELIETKAASVRVLDLAKNSIVEFERSQITEIEKSISVDDAVKTVGLPKVLAWRIEKLQDSYRTIGKIARVTPQAIYVTQGTSTGIKVGLELDVYRNDGEIRDPDSGEVLAIERPKIAKIKVFEVHEKYSKAKLTGDVEVDLQPGNEVESSRQFRIAVCPVYSEDGQQPDETRELVERITNSLVQNKVPVLEGAEYDKVLSEFLATRSPLFDTDKVRKFGTMTGASHVVTGKVVSKSKTRGTVFIRLVDISSGRIILATEDSVGMTTSLTSGGLTGPGVSKGGMKIGMRSLPRGFTTEYAYQKTKGKGIRIQGFNEFTIKKQGRIRSRQSDFLKKNFVYEVIVKFGPDDMVANVGIGNGVADISYNGLKDSVYLRLHSPKMRQVLGGGKVELTRFKRGQVSLGELATVGPHLVRITKEGNRVTFQVDSGNDGPTDDDLETTIADITDYAPFLHSKNSPLFFGGGGEFLGGDVKTNR